MLNSGLLAAFSTLICWTVGTFAFTIASKRTEPAIVNRVRLLFAAILLSAVVVLFFNVTLIQLFTLPTLAEWLWLGLSGIIGLTLGDFFAFSAYRILGSSRTSLFSTFAPVAALLLGIVILGEQLNAVGILGMMISTGGIIWFIRTTQKSKDKTIDKKHVVKGIAFAILGAVGQGLGLVCAKKGLNITHQTGADLTAVHATWIRMLIGTIAAYSIAIFNKKVLHEIKVICTTKPLITPVLTGTVFGPVIGVSLSLYAASQIPVGIAQTIFSLLPITVIFAATVSGREKISKHSIIAASICMIGVFVLVWRDELIYWLS